MKAYLLIAANILIIGLVSYFIVDSNLQFNPFKTQSLCLKNSKEDQLCAECYRRDPKVLRDRAIKIDSNEDITVLKIAEQQTYLSCHDYLQFVNIQKDSKSKGEIPLEQISPITQILSEIKAVLSPRNIKTEHLVQPSFSQFVIYKWGDFSSQQTKVSFPNTEYYSSISFYFLYGFNFILLLILVAWIADDTFLAEQSTPVKLCLVSIVLLMELWFFEILGQTALYLCRLFVLNLGLLRLKVGNFKVIACFIAGLFFAYFQVTVPIYVGGILVLMLYYGRSQSQSTQIQRYLLVFYSLLLLNHIYIYNFVYLLNDFRNLAIDLCLIILIPLGLFLLPNQKKFKPYRPVDPEIRSISLSGYDEEEPTNI